MSLPPVSIHIEALQLTGFGEREGRRIADSIGRELTRLVNAPGFDRARLASLSANRLDAGSVRHEPGSRPDRTGRRVARAIFRSLGP